MGSFSTRGAGRADGDALRSGFLTAGLYALSSFLALGSGSFGIFRFALYSLLLKIAYLSAQREFTHGHVSFTKIKI